MRDIELELRNDLAGVPGIKNIGITIGADRQERLLVLADTSAPVEKLSLIMEKYHQYGIEIRTSKSPRTRYEGTPI